jgi:uncharacterized protein (TIGR03437 family)
MMRTCVLAVACSLVCPAQTARPIPASFFGATTIQAPDYPKFAIGLLGHPSTLAWGWIERSKGVYNFSGFDSYVTQAVQHGLVDDTNTVDMAITFGSTPQWAAADTRTCTSPNGVPICTSPPANMQDWIDFVTAVVNHYNGVTQPHIRYYELWNEANARNFWTGTYDDMLKMAQAAYPIVHRDPYSLLLTPSVAGPVGNAVTRSGSIWMAGYLKTGGGVWADGGAWHGYIGQEGVTPFPMPEEDSTPGCRPFDTCFGSIITKATTMRQVFDDNGMAGKPMYQTEGSWGNGTVTDPDVQVAWLARWLLLQAGMSSTLNLRATAWYAWGGGARQTWGDIETDAGAPTAAAQAYTQVFNWAAGATIAQPCASAPGGTWTCALTRPGGYKGIAVWNTAGSATYLPDRDYTLVRDLAGNVSKIDAGAPVAIGTKPVLIENNPALAVVSAASFAEGTLAPEQIVTAGGWNLTSPAGTRVMVTDSSGVSRLAPLVYASPTQVNLEVPAGTASGLASISVISGDQVSSGSFRIAATSPGLFTANQTGNGVAAAVGVLVSGGNQVSAPAFNCGTAPGSCIPVPLNLGEPADQMVLELFGTGIRGRSSVAKVTCTVGGVPATVLYAGAQGQFQGLDQVNIAVPRSLSGAGQVSVNLIVDGQPANAVLIAIQ